MKKAVAGIPVFLIMLLFSGCDTIGSKTGSVSVAYAIAAIISLLLLVGCFFLLKNRNAWFVVLLSSVLVVNIGYYLLSVAGGKVFFHLQQLSAADLLLDVRHLPPSRLVFCQKPRVSGGHRFGGFPLFTLWCTPSPFRGGCIFRQMRE